jgi:hypothetical protein
MKRNQGPRMDWAQIIAIAVIFLGALAAVLYLWTDRPFYVTALALATTFPVGRLLQWTRRTPPTRRRTTASPLFTPGQ